MAGRKKVIEMEQNYEFTVPSIFKGISANDAGAELERIRKKYGELKPEHVVAESKKTTSILHDLFQWDNKKAAEQFRLAQAANIIRSIRLVIINEEVKCSVRAFVNVRPADNSPRSYVTIQEAVNNEASYKDLLEQAKTDMERFVRKYSQLKELNAVKAEMLKLL